MGDRRERVVDEVVAHSAEVHLADVHLLAAVVDLIGVVDADVATTDSITATVSCVGQFGGECCDGRAPRLLLCIDA